jgi:hypothetical protein
VSVPDDDVPELTSFIERSQELLSFPQGAPVLDVDSLLHLAEVRIQSRAEDVVFTDDLSIPDLRMPESTNKAEVNLVDLVRRTPKHRSQQPKPMPKPQVHRQISLDLRGLGKRKVTAL